MLAMHLSKNRMEDVKNEQCAFIAGGVEWLLLMILDSLKKEDNFRSCFFSRHNQNPRKHLAFYSSATDSFPTTVKPDLKIDPLSC